MGGVSRAQLCMGLTLQALAPCTLLCLGCSQHFETEGIWGELRSLGYRQGSGAATGYLVIWRQPCVQPGTQMLGAAPLLGMEAADGAPGPAWTRTPSIFQGAPLGSRGSGMLVPKAAAPMASSFASTGIRDEKSFSPACLQPTSGTDMDPILQTVAHVPLPLEDFSKTRLSTADLQRFLKQRGDSRGATNYVDEEPDSK